MPDQERWAEAWQIHRWKGEEAPLFVAERIGALALADDQAGVIRFKEIAERLDQIRRGVRH
ncbi:DUF6961 family protein [Sphingomonas panaciterrae]|uniref:DUF6961 family protein n=1 Tax=Sphingomonas panaciterrae TaxID=1462999 RepID=UPI002FF3F156